MTHHLRSMSRCAAVLAAALLIVVLSGCSYTGPTADLVRPTSEPTGSVRIVLQFEDQTVAATLADTPAARDFATMLPLELNLHDPMGQAKSGELPRPIDASGIEPVFDPAVGQIYYSAPSRTLAIFYADLGQSVPDPGLVRLGAVDGGVEEIGDAGNRFAVQIDRVDHPLVLIDEHS